MASKYDAIKAKFKIGDFVVGIGEHVGCSEVFSGYSDFQPFDYLNDYDPDNFRLATSEEIAAAKARYC